MSTPSITAPGPMPSTLERPGRENVVRAKLGRVIRGPQSDPLWSRPLLWSVTVLAGVLTLWGLTRSGYANSYYAEAAQAASHSWKALFTNALDVSGSDSLDKGPLSNMLMGLSGRLFGFSSFSMLLPEALCGIASVVVLHNVVRRTLGHRAAILAALMLALTPIFVAMARFNNPDALLVLMEIAAAWSLVRALESGRTRHLLLCGLFVGLAFNTKMLEAYLIVPALALTFLISGQGSLRRRLLQLTAGGASMLAISFAWYGAMMLLPAADRPWVGDTTDNSWFTLIFGANGLSRVSGGGGGPNGAASFGGAPGPLRLFNSIVGGQIAWLLPLAGVGLLLGLWTHRRSSRTDIARSAYVLWGGWAVVSWAVFSLSKGIFHPYYTVALSPAVAVLSAGALVVLWDRARSSFGWSAALALAVIGTAVLGALLLGRAAGFVRWLAPLAIILAAVAGVALMLARLAAVRRAGPMRRTILRVAAVAGLLAVLAGPMSYSSATVGKSLTGGNPIAGPVTASFGLGGPPNGGARGATGRPPSAPPDQMGPIPNAPAGRFGPPGAPRAGLGFPGGTMGGSVTKATIKYLEVHQGNARYLVAAVGSTTAGAIALESGKDVIDMGGFMGSDPAPSLAQLKHFIDTGQLHYVLLSDGQGGGAGGPGGSSSATQARDEWIRSHGTVVKISGQSATGAALYYLSSSR